MDLPVTDEMKKVKLLAGNHNPFTEYYVDGNKHIFKEKSFPDYRTVVVDLDKMIIESDISDYITRLATFEIYDSTGECIEFD